MYRRNMSVASDRNTTLLKRPSRIYRATLPTITCLELGDRVAAQLATQVVLALSLESHVEESRRNCNHVCERQPGSTRGPAEELVSLDVHVRIANKRRVKVDGVSASHLCECGPHVCGM